MIFPRTGLLDDFTRADGALGANWTQDPTTAVALNVSTNQAASAAAGLATMHWTAQSFPPNQEARVQIPALPGPAAFVEVDIRADNLATPTKYKLRVIVSTSSWELRSHVANGSSTLLATFSQAVLAGDWIGLRGLGALLEAWYITAAGVASPVGSLADSGILKGGFVGMSSNDTGARLDNFSGGPVPSDAVPIPLPVLVP